MPPTLGALCPGCFKATFDARGWLGTARNRRTVKVRRKLVEAQHRRKEKNLVLRQLTMLL